MQKQLKEEPVHSDSGPEAWVLTLLHFLESSNHTTLRRRQSPKCFLQWEANWSRRNDSLFFCTDRLVGGKQDQSNSNELKEIHGCLDENPLGVLHSALRPAT